MITRRQRDLLKFIAIYLAREGVVPTFDEMKLGVGLKSKSGVHRMLGGLQDKGYLRRLPHRARAIEIIQVPSEIGGNACPVCGHKHAAAA